MLMSCSDRYFLELSAIVLLKEATKGVIVLQEDFKYYYCSIISFILNSGKRHNFKVSLLHVFAFLILTPLSKKCYLKCYLFATLLKRGSNTDSSCEICEIFENTSISRTLPLAASNIILKSQTIIKYSFFFKELLQQMLLRKKNASNNCSHHRYHRYVNSEKYKRLVISLWLIMETEFRIITIY